jgi:hypothetical protein
MENQEEVKECHFRLETTALDQLNNKTCDNASELFRYEKWLRNRGKFKGNTLNCDSLISARRLQNNYNRHALARPEYDKDACQVAKHTVWRKVSGPGLSQSH